MRPIIDWKECIKDSPKFRSTLEEAEKDLDSLEIHLEKLLKQCDWMQETGKVFNSANGEFISSIRQLMLHFNDDYVVLESLGKITHTLSDWQGYHNKMLEQCNRVFSQNINFIRNDVHKVKDSRRHFQKMADEMDNVLFKSAQTSPSKPDECDEVTTQLNTTRANFTRASLEHVFEINLMQMKKRLDLLNALFWYIQTQNKCIHNGFELFTNLEPFTKKLTSELEEVQRKTNAERLRLTDKQNTLLSCNMISSSNSMNEDEKTKTNEVKMEGYLFKRTSNAFKTWVRRWFVVDNNQLTYCSRQRSKESMTVIEKDLRLCNVKPFYDIDRRFCFQVTSPLRSHVLQADSDVECQEWISAIQDGATKAYNRPTSPVRGQALAGVLREDSTSIGSRRSSAPSLHLSPSLKHPPQQTQSNHLQTILSVAGNNICCDCRHVDPRWASINFGITLCIECSAIHRSFGVHKSKVRSLTLDAWEPDHIKLMQQLGNQLVNQIFESSVDVVNLPVQRAQPNCNRLIRESWITAKYIDRSFVRSSCCNERKFDGIKIERTPPSSHFSNNFTSFADVLQPSHNHQSSSALIQVASQDSGLGGTNDVFGSNVSDQSSCLGLEDSHSAISDLDSDADIQSTPVASEPSANYLLCKAALTGNSREMLKSLALGADPNWNCKSEEGKTPLIRAIESGQMLSVEFLLLNGSKVDISDDLNRTPLHHATILGHAANVCQLLKRNANQHLKDINGQDALEIAVKKADANIVTILRLSRLNEEMKETDVMYDVQDDMVSQVFKDFTNLNNRQSNE